MKRFLAIALLLAGLCAAGRAQTVTVGGFRDTYVNPSLGSTPVLAEQTIVTLKTVSIYNPSAAVAYVQVFDASSAAQVNLGTTPPKYVIPVATAASVHLDMASGITFRQGIVLSATTAPTGTAGPATALVISLVCNNARVD